MKNSKRMLNLAWMFVLLLACLCTQAFAEENTMYGIGFVKANALHLRQETSTSSKSLAYAQKNECVAVVSQEGDWWKVIYNLNEGYMHKDYLTVSTVENAELGYGKVNASSVNLRSGPSTASARVAVAAKDAKCYILGLNEGWYKVIYSSQICYICSDYLELTEIPYENQASKQAPKFFRLGKSTGVAPSAAALNGNAETAKAVTGQQIVDKAKQYLGTPYVYGGASPSGFDCSGFTYYVFSQLGFSIARTPAAQISLGRAVAQSAMKPGDIVFFSGTGGASGISHVGIYVGNQQFIHAPNSRSVVSIADLSSGYWAQHFHSAHRVVD